MNTELQSLLHEVFLKEKRLNVLYHALAEGDSCEETVKNFYVKARTDQDGDLEMLQAINERYGDGSIEPGILEKLGETLLQLTSDGANCERLLRQALDYESELIEDYKRSLRFLTADDETRRMINKILTIKLLHKRDVLDKLKMY